MTPRNLGEAVDAATKEIAAAFQQGHRLHPEEPVNTPLAWRIYEWLLAEARWYAAVRKAQRDRYIILLSQSLETTPESMLKNHLPAPWEGQ